MRFQYLNFIVLLLLCPFAAFTQTSDPEMLQSMRVKIPGSPDAARLGTYGEFKMTQTTGIPSVDFPITSIEAGGISIPVSLSYQSSGLKIDELPSWVGMGWSLTAGGVITRTLKGKCDDMYDGFHSFGKAVPDQGIYERQLADDNLRTNAYRDIEVIFEGQYDYEPDLYSFNFGERSGSFILGNEAAGNATEEVLAYPLDYSGLKIKPVKSVDQSIATYPVIREWIVTDESGLVYRFSDIETTSVRIADQQRDTYISSWYLTSIYNPLTETTATFSYASGAFQYDYTENYDDSYKYENISNQSEWNERIVHASQYISHRNIKFISGITLKNFSLTFSGTASLEYPRKLETIVWSNGTDTRTYKLGYDYFEPSKRLKLTSFREEHPTNPKVHTFDYYPGEVPHRKHRGQDSWGYYNGQANSSLIPTISYRGRNFGFGANRSPSFAHTQIGMLSKITYPTKGHSNFIYEQNTWQDAATAKDLEHVTLQATREVTGQSTLGEVCSTVDVGIRSGGDGAVSPNIDYSLRYTVRVLSMGLDDGKTYPKLTISEMPSKLLRSHLLNPTQNGYVIEGTIPASELVQGSTVRFAICAYGTSQTARVEVELIEVDRTKISTPIARATAGLRIGRIENYDPESAKTNIKTFDYGLGGYSVGAWTAPNPQFFRTYRTGVGKEDDIEGENYELSTLVMSPFATSGIAPSPSQVAYEKVVEWLGTPVSNTGRIETIFTKVNDNTSALVPQSNHQQRSRIKSMRYFDSSGELKKEETFQYETSVVGGVTGLRVLRLRHIQGDAFRQHLTDFSFANYTESAVWTRLKLKTTETFFGAGNPSVVESIAYEYGSNRHTNVTKETTSNSKGEQLQTTYGYPLDASTKNFANHPRNYYPTYLTKLSQCRNLNLTNQSGFKSCQTTEINLLVSNYNTFIGDLASENANATNATNPPKAFTALNSLNVISQPYELKQYNGTSEMSRMLVTWTYKTNVVGTDKPVKDQFSLSYKGGALQPVLKVNVYNSMGDPVEVLDYKAGFVTSYIWEAGYENLIAEVKNAKVGDVAHTSFENGQEGNLSFTPSPASVSKTGTKSHLLYGKSVSKGGLTSSKRYIVSYWAKDGSISVTGVVSSNDNAAADDDGWRYFEKTVSGVSTITISSATTATKIDELRIYPENAQMTSFVHKPGVGISSVTDPNSQISYFTYDSASGNLVTAEDHYRNILRMFQYNFKK